MKKNYLLCILLLLGWAASAQQHPKLEFIKNKGQWDGDFEYKSITGTGDVFLQKNAITYMLGEAGARDKIDAFKHGQLKTPPVIKYHTYRVYFEGCSKAVLSEQKVQSHYYNYFLGNDSSRWQSNIHPALTINYGNLYNGVDMHLSSEGGNLKYDFIVAPAADPDQVKLKFDGVDKLSVSKEGNLLITTSIGVVTEQKPVAYQYIDDQRITVPCSYKLANNTVSFVFPKGYSKEQTLIIDPTVVFCTFTGSTADNWGFTATYDPVGNMYTGGLVSLNNGGSFPITTGAFQVTYGGGTSTTGSFYACDMGIMKISADGASKIYATYIGGSDNDQPHSMIVDKDNNLIIAGRTYSNNFPTSGTAYDKTHNGKGDIVIVKLNVLGSGIIGSTYIGGSGDDCVNFDADEFKFGGLKHNYGDDARSEVIIDNNSNIYVTASTKSTNFPTLTPIQAANAGGQDAVLIKFNPDLSTLLFSTYLGGAADDAGYVLSLNNAQSSIYVAGGTMSSDFPSKGSTYHPAFLGGTDGYLLKIANGPAYTLQAGTFIGTNSYDQVFGVQVDNDDNVYTMGQTLGGTFPVTTGVYSNPNSSQFVLKMDNNLAAPIYSTVFGSGNSTATNISPVAFLVDTCQNVYISGWGGTLASPPGVGTTDGMPTTPTAIFSTTDGADFYFIVLGKNASTLLYGSYFGRVGVDPLQGEHVDGGTSRFDKNGIIYQAMCGGCGLAPTITPFPTTTGSLSPNKGADNCNLAALKLSFDLGAVKAEIDVTPNAKGCPPFTVNFENRTFNGKTYTWDFGDGSASSTIKEPTHTFYTPGVYSIRMVAYNPDACIEYDTSYLTITVDNNSIHSDFDIQILDSCESPYAVSFTNISRYGTSGKADFIWDFGDGTLFGGTNPPVHSYKSQGTYIVTLVMIDTSACNSPDTMRKTFTISSNLVKAAASIPDAVCAGAGGVIYLGSSSINATSVIWDFGDGTTSTDPAPNHKFDTGTYTITLIALNNGACNESDTFRKRIVVRAGATADFVFSPTIPSPNDSIHYTNLSQGAISYLWTFGDASQSRVVHPAHLFRKTGFYRTCLVAQGLDNCNDTICKTVEAIVIPLLDVPTAFTPDGDMINDMIFVRGAAIETMDFRIYNRWGQLVFQSSSPEIGWDGTFNGKPQPMESYGYVLVATFIDGTSDKKQGNINLLR